MAQSVSKRLLSPSRINCFLTCPRQHYLRYELKVKELPSPEYFEFGSKVHKIIRTYYENIPNDISPKEITLFISQAVKKVNTEMTEKLMQHLQGFTKFEENRLSWHINPKPIFIEKDITKPPFHGVIDAVFKKDNEVVAVDWKSGYNWNPQLDEKMLIQGSIYRYLTNANRIFFIFIKYNKWLEIPKADKKLIDKIRSAIEGIESGINHRVKGWQCTDCSVNLYCNFEERRWTLWDI